MRIFKTISTATHYWLDSLKAGYIKVKIERFSYDKEAQQILVIFRIGNKRTLNKISILQFEYEHFENCANYDQHRLTKFSSYQKILDQMSEEKLKLMIIDFIDKEAKNEQLF